VWCVGWMYHVPTYGCEVRARWGAAVVWCGGWLLVGCAGCLVLLGERHGGVAFVWCGVLAGWLLVVGPACRAVPIAGARECWLLVVAC
jgi:hypothetical protein